MASSSSFILKAAEQLSPAVGVFSVDFSSWMRFLSSLLKRRRLTAAYSFIKALALPRLVVNVQPVNVLATQDARLTGLYEDMHPGGFPAFLRGKMMAIFQT